MLFNESATDTADTVMTLPEGVGGACAVLRLAEDKVFRTASEDGRMAVKLLPGQSEILVFGELDELALSDEPAALTAREITPTYTVDVAHAKDLNGWEHLTVTRELFNVTSAEHLPNFSGKMRYTFHLPLDNVSEQTVLDLGTVGQTARLKVNGHDAGIRMSAPYRFAIGPYLQAGDNTLTVEVANTLVGVCRDRFSHFLPLLPSGLLGPVVLETEQA
jgi:hypothetical protein